MSELQYTTVDRIISKFHRDLRGTSLNESDAIEWIGEALDFLKVVQVQEEAIAFVEVKNFEAELPLGFHNILQIARNNKITSDSTPVCVADTLEAVQDGGGCGCDNGGAGSKYPVPLDCCGKPLTDYDVAYYRPFFDLQGEYFAWTKNRYYKENFTPVRLSNHSFFKSLVCKETNFEDLYSSAVDEYTLVGTINKKLRFSFETGQVAISYLKNAVDRETGYPLVPDQISYITAISYYIRWKLAEWKSFNNREGSVALAQDSERKWLKYARQAKNYMKMPKGLDQHQNLLEQSHKLIPRKRTYYGYFGSLGRLENRPFNDPDNNRNYR